MKKVLSLLLALVMCLSLCACGGGSTNNTNTENSTPDTNTSNTTPVVHRIGDTVTTKMFNCTLGRAEFAEEVGNYRLDGYLLPDGKLAVGETAHYAKDGYKLLSFTFELTYLGTTEYSFSLGQSDGMDLMVKFDNTYEFDSFVISGSTFPIGEWDKACELKSGHTMTSLSNPAFKFAPLDETVHEFRAYIEVPDKVAESIDKPAEIIITLCDEDVVYSIR